MAPKEENFKRIRGIFSETDELNVRERHGGKFYFPIYMTETMEKTDIEVLELSVRSFN